MWIAVYLGLNICYSVFEMKNIPLIDILILNAGFVIHVIYGGAILNIPVSAWLYLVIVTVSFYFALGESTWKDRKRGLGKVFFGIFG